MTAHKIYRAAADVVRSRICDRPVIPVETLITGLSIPVQFRGRATSIWSAVAKLWGVGEGQLRADDRFAEVFRVFRSDLPDLPPAAWEEAGLKVGLDVHPYDSDAMRRFVRLDLGDDLVPDESTILRFRHLLEQHQLTAALFAAIGALLEEKRLWLKTGTIVDATIIAAPPSTKNATKTRDPEMHQPRQGPQWHFGMKLDVGTDLRGSVHHVTATNANTADVTQRPALLTGQERDRYGDKAVWQADDGAQWTLAGGRYRVNKRGTTGAALTAHAGAGLARASGYES